MIKAIYAGTFDPPTQGHIDIVKAASEMFEHIMWLIAVNPIKKTMFSPDERVQMMKTIAHRNKLDNVLIGNTDGLVGEYARTHDYTILIRSFRNVTDMSEEMDLCMNNRQLFPNLQTIFIPVKQEHMHISSTAVRFLLNSGQHEAAKHYIEELLCMTTY